MRFAIDTGGTFTDLIVEDDEGECRMFKARTTPDDPITGLLNALTLAADAYGMTLGELLRRGEILVHGTTRAINAIITGRTARTALLVTRGHRDVLVLREGGRSDPFNFTDPYPQPYVPRSLTFEIPERVRADGSVMVPLDEAAVRAAAAELASRKIEAVAVCLLWSIINPAHEMRIGELLAECLPGVPFTLSHALNPTIREFRRASSAAVDASLKPTMGTYMRTLESRLHEAGFAGRTLVVTSGAGVIDARDAAEAPIHIVNSGPSMAPLAGRHYALMESGSHTAIVADTGGTTYDVSLVRKGHIPTSRETWIGEPYRGTMIGFPWVDVKSVGAGGGSIAWIDSGGLLRVGPKSAGAVPGPAAYGRGGVEPTVTDASIALGHLDPDYFLGGAIKLNRDLAVAAIRQIADPLKLGVAEAANAIISIATENMVQAIVDITVNQGVDPRQAVLVGGGGAAGLNSVRIASRLGCRTLIIPDTGAALSAAGAMMSSLKADFHAAFFVSTSSLDFDGVKRTLDRLSSRCRAFIDGPGAGAVETAITFKVDARYDTQVWEIEVLLRGKLASEAELASFVQDFHLTHENLFGFSDPISPIEIIAWTAEVNCRFREQSGLRLTSAATLAERPNRAAYFHSTDWVDVPVRQFNNLVIGEAVSGPAIVESSFTTIVVDPGAVATRQQSGSLLIEVEQSQ
ncbi:5-oxoprolinase [Mesorhizobium sp. Root102]|uniref:hydantoinase/oxoprolinase family protein n=1 Tax=Mesorhizobium sp. Root102 TaxID=1736422 RepID=UPI0006FF1CF4|nr:hydantoinase/oxoprolinase family protein [Mesorhizobium sp. Root102]KQU92799.1 5-oxoprolinase [Mesorhizobium sp. Root102]